MENTKLMKLTFDVLCPGNKILFDETGKESVMVKVPKQSYAQLGLGESPEIHPAFIINGKEVNAIYISKYENVIENGMAYSLPIKAPAVSINYDDAQNACIAKGRGWHLMTKVEWSMLSQWCMNQGVLPSGNCYFGKDLKEKGYQAFPATESVGRTNIVLTGSGPYEWSHNQELSGIWDLKGNIGEWMGGARTVYGELQLLVDNNGADCLNSQDADSCCWKAIDGVTGQFCNPNGNGTTKKSLKLEYDEKKWVWTVREKISRTDNFYGCPFEAVECDGEVSEAARMLLKAYGFYKANNRQGAYEGDYFYADSSKEERLFGCGGHFKHGTEAGIFCTHGTTGRAAVSVTRGFRSAYVELAESQKVFRTDKNNG